MDCCLRVVSGISLFVRRGSLGGKDLQLRVEGAFLGHHWAHWAGAGIGATI